MRLYAAPLIVAHGRRGQAGAIRHHTLRLENLEPVVLELRIVEVDKPPWLGIELAPGPWRIPPGVLHLNVTIDENDPYFPLRPLKDGAKIIFSDDEWLTIDLILAETIG